MPKVNMGRFARELMGRQVKFTQRFKRHGISTPGTHPPVVWTWKPEDLGPRDNQIGWIIGVRWLQTGRTMPNTSDRFGFEDDYDLPTFEETAPRILAYLVVPHPAQNYFLVPPEAITVQPEYLELPTMDAETRKFLSEDSKNWPRDSRGRFSKGV